MSGDDNATFTREEKASIFSELKNLCVAMAELKIGVKGIADSLPDRPCLYQKELEKRVLALENAKKETAKDWKDIGKGLIDKLLWAACVGVLAYLKGKGAL